MIQLFAGARSSLRTSAWWAQPRAPALSSTRSQSPLDSRTGTTSPSRSVPAGLADEVRERLPAAVEVVLAPRDAEASAPVDHDRLGRTPQVLFREYLAERDVADDRMVALFDELVDELVAEP